MARTESLMGNGRLYPENKPGQNGVEVKYQLQVTTDDDGRTSEWDGYLRLPQGKNLPGTNSASPKGNARFYLVLEDNENRKGSIKIERAVGTVGGFHNYAIRGDGPLAG